MLTGSDDGKAILWQADSGKMVRAFAASFPSTSVFAVAFHPGGNQVLTGSQESGFEKARLVVWDAGTGKEIRTFRTPGGHVYSVAFGPDGTQVLSASGDKTAILWDAATGKELRRLGSDAKE